MKWFSLKDEVMKGERRKFQKIPSPFMCTIQLRMSDFWCNLNGLDWMIFSSLIGSMIATYCNTKYISPSWQLFLLFLFSPSYFFLLLISFFFFFSFLFLSIFRFFLKTIWMREKGRNLRKKRRERMFSLVHHRLRMNRRSSSSSSSFERASYH